MEREGTNRTIILLIDGKLTSNDGFIKEWLEASPFMTNETTDIFQALEDISDFTMRSRPDVVLLEVGSLEEDFFTIRDLMEVFSLKDSFPIFALSDCGKVVNDKGCFEGTLAEVKAEIKKVFPKSSRAVAGAQRPM
jgi:hypothetical protein